MFTKACEYAIRAVLYIAMRTRDGVRVGIPEVAREIQSPESFTAKILQNLVRKKIIRSSKGPMGGFYFDVQRKKLTLHDVVKAVEKKDVSATCAMGLKKCDDRFPCPIHDVVKPYKARLQMAMNSRTILQMSEDVRDEKSFLRNERIKAARKRL